MFQNSNDSVAAIENLHGDELAGAKQAWKLEGERCSSWYQWESTSGFKWPFALVAYWHFEGTLRE